MLTQEQLEQELAIANAKINDLIDSWHRALADAEAERAEAINEFQWRRMIEAAARAYLNDPNDITRQDLCEALDPPPVIGKQARGAARA